MKPVASRCKPVACNAQPPALHAVAHPFRGATENATQREGQSGDDQARAHNGTHRNGKAKPARLPLGSFYARVDRYGRHYLSGRLGLMKLMLFETTEVSQGDTVWEGVLVEGPHVSNDQRALAQQVEEVQP